MARKKLNFTATEGRDKGKNFTITEMSAMDIEDWAGEAFFLLIGAGVEIPDDVAQMGLAGLMTMGLEVLGRVPYKAAKPLLDRMLDCVVYHPDPANPNVTVSLTQPGVEIEEVKTLFTLRKLVWGLHTDFLSAAAP